MRRSSNRIYKASPLESGISKSSEFVTMKYLFNIIWTSVSKFTRNEVYNRYSFHYWSDLNVHSFKEENFQDFWQFNVYCAIRNNGFVT